MAFVSIVTNGKGTTVRKLDMTGHTTNAVDSAADALLSVICDEREILHIEVDYEGCNDSKTV